MEDISQENLIINDLSLFEKQQLEENTQSTSSYISEERNLLDSNPITSTQIQSSISIEPASTDTQGVPSDPSLISGNFWEQWHHTGANGLNAMGVWDDYTGAGVRVGVLDDGFNYNHSELSGNFRTDLDYDVLGNDANSINDFGDNHGTYVAQILAGDDNGARTVGVAFDADLVGIRRGFGSEGTTQDTLDAFEYALANDFDIMNNSWGMDVAFADNIKIDFIGTDTSAVVSAMNDLVAFGRDGLGTNIVFSAGNNRVSGQSANYKNYQNSPYSITVGAISEDGTFADFSEAGSNLLVSAAGDSLYVANPTDTNSSHIISGTSFAAPAVSGVIALMLEANADLGFRDVQEILAMSSRQTDSNGTGWAGEGWQTNGAANWNGGGMHFSHDYGYGNVDALAAVRMAETWNLQQTFVDMTAIQPVSSAPALSIPSVGTITTTIEIVENIDIEHVLIDLDISHTRTGDLVVTLTSPDGTDSVLMYHVENGAYTSRYGITGVDFGFSSTAHWGEESAGEWTLTVADETGGNAGTLNDWSLAFLGKEQSNDDLYVYTNEYAGSEGVRTLLSDTDGGIDTINAAAVSTDTTIDLNFGGTIAGTIFVIDPGTLIENVYTGDGNDNITGDDEQNFINTGRGDDTINGSLGNDWIDGGQGNDTVIYDYDLGEFLVTIADSIYVAFQHVAQNFTHSISNIENFIFNDGTYTRAEIDDYIANGGGQQSFVNTQLKLGYNGAIAKINNLEAGTFMYTGEDIGQAGNTADVLRVMRNDTYLNAQVQTPGSGEIDTVTLSNDDLTHVSMSGFLYTKINISNSTRDVVVDLNNTVQNKIDTGSGNDHISAWASPISTSNTLYTSQYVINTRGGDDHVSIGGILAPTTKIYLGAGDDHLTNSQNGSNRVYGEDGNDTITVSGGNDRVYGGNGNDIINGGAGLDRLEGGEGNDIINGGDGNDSLFGDAGSDTLDGGAGADRVRGGYGNDDLSGGDGRDRVYGDAGDDIVNGNAGKDFLRGGDGVDTLRGGTDSDKLYGDNGADTLYGEDGFDALYGGNGDDGLYGGADNDRLYGQADNDVLDGGAGNDLLDGGSGNDTLEGGDGNDRLYGRNGNDLLQGGSGHDRLYGDGDNDRLEGGDGNDYLYAGSGIDTLIGGAGADRLYGDTGQDTFGLTDISTGVDKIYNFTSGEDILNITDLLTGYNHGVDDINDFVQLLDLGNGSSDLRINAGGDLGGSYGRVALVYNDFSGATVDDLVADGSLVADQAL